MKGREPRHIGPVSAEHKYIAAWCKQGRSQAVQEDNSVTCTTKLAGEEGSLYRCAHDIRCDLFACAQDARKLLGRFTE